MAQQSSARVLRTHLSSPNDFDVPRANALASKLPSCYKQICAMSKHHTVTSPNICNAGELTYAVFHFLSGCKDVPDNPSCYASNGVCTASDW